MTCNLYESKYINIGYTDKLSYTNNENVKLYIDSVKNIENAYLNITDINNNIVKKIVVKLEKQIYKGNGYDIYHKRMGIYEKPWENFILDFTCEFDLKDFKSGVYIIDNNIIFIVREYYNSTNRAPICCLISTNTINMYNYFGGTNGYYGFRNQKTEKDLSKEFNEKYNNNLHHLYSQIARDGNTNESKRAKVVQINRPIDINLFFIKNIGFLKYLFNSNYKVNYITDKDLDEDIYNAFWDNSEGDKLKLFVISGHSEYWTLKSRKNLEKINQSGTNILNLSGNSLWSRVSYSDDNKMIHKRYENDDCDIPDKYLDLAKKTTYFCNNNYNSFQTTGVDYLYGGHNFIKKNNKYIKYDNLKILDEIDEIVFEVNSGAEFDGFKTDFYFSHDDLTNEIINDFPEKIQNYKYLFELDKIYDCFKYKKILMYGVTPTINFKTGDYYCVKSTGIIALKKNDETGTIINCCYSDWCDKSFDTRKLIVSRFIDCLLLPNFNFNETFMNNNYCPVCDITCTTIENRYCNECGSVERHRALIKTIKDNNISDSLKNQPILILSEGKRKCNKYYETAYYFNKISNKLKTLDIRDYGGTCFKDNQFYDYVHNCEDLSFIKNGEYKAIVLNHVLTSIKNDLTALSEFNRILKNDGIVLITDGIKEGNTELYDSSSSTMCCRLYGENDFEDILKNFFSDIEKYIVYDNITKSYNNIYICFKKGKQIEKIVEGVTLGSTTDYKKNISYKQ